jgi:predicted kinase
MKNKITTFLCLLISYLSCPLEAETDFSEIFKEQSTSLQNLEVAHEPFVIAFSGVPGMGKTEVAKALESSLKAIRLSSDSSRQILIKHGIKPYEKNPQTQQTNLEAYMGYCLELLSKQSANHRIILDMSIDREYPLVSSLAQKHGYKLFIIRLVVPRTIVEQRIRAREVNPESYLKHLDKWYQDYNAFDQKNVNFFLDNSQESLQLQELVKELYNASN